MEWWVPSPDLEKWQLNSWAEGSEGVPDTTSFFLGGGNGLLKVGRIGHIGTYDFWWAKLLG